MVGFAIGGGVARLRSFFFFAQSLGPSLWRHRVMVGNDLAKVGLDTAVIFACMKE